MDLAAWYDHVPPKAAIARYLRIQLLNALTTPYVEGVIESRRSECLDHVVVLGESHLRRIVRSYVTYYQRASTHLALGKDAPYSRAVHSPGGGHVIEIPEVGGLHHRYERRAA